MTKKSTNKVAQQNSGFKRKHSELFVDRPVKKPAPGNKPRVKSRKSKKTDESATKEIEKKDDTTETTKENSGKQKKEGKKPRFILFVGNLPYTCTKEDLEEHFQKAGELQAVRLLTKKEDGQEKPRGCAFVEYKTSAAMLNALLYHHTTFKERKINVEMTCGGGGNSKTRKKKLEKKRNKSNDLIHKMLQLKKKTKGPIK